MAQSSLNDFSSNALDLSRKTTRKKNRKSIPCKIEYIETDDFVSPYRVSKSCIEEDDDAFVPISKNEEKCVDCSEMFSPSRNDYNCTKNSNMSFNVICKTEKCVENSTGFGGNGVFKACKAGDDSAKNNLICKIKEDNCRTSEKIMNSCIFDSEKQIRKVTENNSTSSCPVDERSTEDMHAVGKTEDKPVLDSCVLLVSVKTENVLLNGCNDSIVPSPAGNIKELTAQGCPALTTCNTQDLEENFSTENHENASTPVIPVCKVEVSTEDLLETPVVKQENSSAWKVEKSFSVKTEVEENPNESSCDKSNEDSNESSLLLTPACEIDEGSTESASPTCESEETEIEDNYELITPSKEEEETPKPPPKANYHCEICSKQFTRKDSLAEHVRIHTGEKPYKCNVCFKRFARKKDYYKHRAIHTGEKHACHLCFKEFAIRSSLRKHIQTHKGEKHHKCGMCDKQFAHKSTLLFHLKTHTGEEPHHCEVCGKKFARKNDLSRHWLTHSGEKNYQCELCFKQFSTKSNLSQHLLIHSDIKTYQCEICLKLFSQKTGLLKHMPIHSEKNFECEVCHKQFSLQSTLTKHMQTHAEVKPYQCELCFKRFALKSTFSGHLLTHTGERHHPCELCPKRFARKSHLARHMLTHTGEKPHKCEVCLKAFAQKSDITQHMLTHTGEKPHHCTMCNKKYSKRSHLTHHMLNHHADKLPRPDPMPVPLGLYPSPIPNPPFYELRSIEVKATPFLPEVCISAKQSPAPTTDSLASEGSEAVLPP